MKRFRFSLETVLSYKQQVLEALQIAHAEILAQVAAQTRRLEECWARYRDCNAEYRGRAAEGILLTDALIYEGRLRAMEREIQQETEKLEALQRQEEEKRQEVVEARKETASIEKLREKKLAAYHKEEGKQEEQFIDEFVSSLRARQQTIA